jgi:hypothetical protein
MDAPKQARVVSAVAGDCTTPIQPSRRHAPRRRCLATLAAQSFCQPAADPEREPRIGAVASLGVRLASLATKASSSPAAMGSSSVPGVQPDT